MASYKVVVNEAGEISKSGYTDAKKRYNQKIKQIKIEFNLSPEDQNALEKLESLVKDSGKSQSAFVKKIVTDYVQSQS